MKKLSIDWGTNIYDQSIANGFGYRKHNENLYNHLSWIANIHPRAKNRVVIRSPEFVESSLRKKKVNWVFSMFEGTELPSRYLEPLSKADYWLVPSTWVKEVFSKYFDKDKIFVVNHGVLPLFYYKKRKFPHKKKFRYLWVGAPNPRKGYQEIMEVWVRQGFAYSKNVELYCKTSGEGIRGKVMQKANVILDGRILSDMELANLYRSAHCFVMPHKGEGFGLTLAESMSTGMPCIATGYSGVTDFFDDEVGYPIGYKMGEGIVTFVGTNDTQGTQLAYPNLTELCNSMIYVFENYDEALRKGKKASKRMRKFTWNKSAQTLVDIIRGTL